MNREIKFRAWDTINEIMIDSPYFFEPNTYHKEYAGDFQYYVDWRDLEDGITRPCYIMQFTGLTDKHGKEVYHNDIVQGFGKLWLISWQNEEARFWIAPYAGNSSTWKYMDEVNRMTVIGNIYQNPDLLTPAPNQGGSKMRER